MSLSTTHKLVISAVGFFGVATYLLATRLGPTPTAESRQTVNVSQPQRLQQAARPTRCVPPPDPSTSPQEMLEMRTRVISSAHRQAYAEALPQLRSMAALDPGYPGLNLDIAMSLLDLKKPDAAKQSIETQIQISECLAKLPADELAAYCRDEVFQRDIGRCKDQLQTIQHSAYLGAQLVQTEVGRALPSSFAEDQPAAAAVAKRATPTRVKPSLDSTDHTLAQGAGTDAQLGAYSK